MGFTKSTKSALSSSHSSLSQSQSSGYGQGEQGSLDKTPELEQRLELLELLVNEVNKKLDDHLKTQSRPAVLSRYRRILKRALGRFLPGSSIASQNTHDSVSANSDSDSQILYIMNWLKNQQAAGRTDRSLSQPSTEKSQETLHMLHSSFLPHIPPLAPPPTGAHPTPNTFELPNNELYSVSAYLNTSSSSELMVTSPLSELMVTSPLSELMTTNPISELMITDPMSELMDTEIGAMSGFRTSTTMTAERMFLLGASHLPDSPVLPTSPGVSPVSSSATSGSPHAPSNIWSPVSTHIPLSDLRTESPPNYTMHTPRTSYGPHQSSNNGLLAEVSLPEIHSNVVHAASGLVQDFNHSPSCMGHSLSPTPSRLTAYLPRPDPMYSVTPLMMRHSGNFGTMNTWSGHGSSGFSPSEHRNTNSDWNPSPVDNEYVHNPNQFGQSTPSPDPVTVRIGHEETSAPMTDFIDEAASGQVAGTSSRYGCHHCDFYPSPGPDQHKKLRKHERTVKHLRMAGQGEVDIFPCSQCVSTFNRRDNLRQHQKSCARRIRRVRRLR